MVSIRETVKPDNIVKKQAKNSGRIAPLIPYQFKPGVSANPNGRPKGSRNKFAEEFIKDFLADWEMAGASAIQECRLADPAAYVRIAASLVPKEFNFKPGSSQLDTILEQFSDEQLASLINSIGTAGVETSGDTT